MDHACQRGQAAVEWVGVTVVVALAVAAATLWLVPLLRPPPAPPGFIDAVARPVATPTPSELRAMQRQAVLDRLVLLRGRPGTRVGWALRATGRGMATGFDVWLEARHAFSTNFNRRMLERLEAVLRDPLGDPTQMPDLSILTPSGIARRAAAMRAYVRRLRAMSAREAIVTAAGDAGSGAADVTVEVGQAALRRGITRGARRPEPPREPRAPTTPPDAPAP